MNNDQDFLVAAKEQIRVLEGIMNQNTYRQYQRAWRDFVAYLELECVPPVSDGLDLKRSQIEHHLNKFKMTPATYNQRLSAIFTLLYRIEGDNPRLVLPNFQKWQGRSGIKALKFIPKEKLFMDSIELEEVRSAFYDLNPDRHIRNRNLLVFDIINELWLRVSEVSLINLEDIDIKSKKMSIRGKGSASDSEGNRAVSAVVSISNSLVGGIIQYVDNDRLSRNEPTKPPLGQSAIESGAALFTTRESERISESSLKKHFAQAVAYAYNRETAMPASHAAHSIRRTRATLHHSEHKDIVFVSRKLRHQDIKTTMLYLDMTDGMMNL